jgi:hypothetical protein
MKFIRFGFITALLGGSFMATAEYPDAGQEDWKVKGSDPSEIISRLEIRNEYLGLPDGGHLDQTYLRGDYAPTKNIVFRLDLPLADGSRENSGNHFGMGDLILGGRGKLELTENLSWMLGTMFILDTASNEVLGTGWNQIVPGTYLVWKPSRQWILSVGYEYAASFGGSDNSELKKISESLFRPGALYHLPKGFWLWLDPKIYVNHEQESDTAFVLEGEFGKVVTANVEVWLRGGGNVAGGEAGREERLGWKAEAGIRYLFE